MTLFNVETYSLHAIMNHFGKGVFVFDALRYGHEESVDNRITQNTV
jgi:hypothetical protein